MKVLSLVLLFLSLEIFPKSSKIVTFGHNLSPTTHQLKAGNGTVGVFVSAIGITDWLMAGTSPWLIFDYNMHNLLTQARIYKSNNHTISVRGSYYQTYDDDSLSNYRMESFTGQIIWGYKFNERTSLHSNFSYMVFNEDQRPFSIRRQTGNLNDFQYNTSTLLEHLFTSNWGMNFEIGFLGMNYEYPQLITGTSVHYRVNSWYFQAGVSLTGTPRAYFDGSRRSNFWKDQPDESELLDDENIKRDFSPHPEIQIQYYF